MMAMNPKQVGALRRAGIYFVVGYGGLVLVNNSGLELDNMWIATCQCLLLFTFSHVGLMPRLRVAQATNLTIDFSMLPSGGKAL